MILPAHHLIIIPTMGSKHEIYYGREREIVDVIDSNALLVRILSTRKDERAWQNLNSQHRDR